MSDFHWFLTSVVSKTKSRSCITTFNASILRLKKNELDDKQLHFYLKLVTFGTCSHNCRSTHCWLWQAPTSCRSNQVTFETLWILLKRLWIVSLEFVRGLTTSQHMYISKEQNKLEDRHLHVNHSTFHRTCFLTPDYDGVYKQHWWKKATLLDTHTLLPQGITSSVLLRYFFNCCRTRLYHGATYFHPQWTRGGSMWQRQGFAATWWVHGFRWYCSRHCP